MSETIFDFLIQPPAESYVDHIVLSGNGYTEIDPGIQERTPWIAHGMSHIFNSWEIDYRTNFVKLAFLNFGGSEISRVITVSYEQIEDYFFDPENQEKAGVYHPYDDLILTAARFLTGQCTSEECKMLLNWPEP